MDTMTTKNVLDEIKSRVAYYEHDPNVRKMFYEALDTAINGLENYERLLKHMLEENRAQLIAEQHKIDLQIQQYEMFMKNPGGNIP